MFVRNPYNYDRHEASRESGLACKGVSKTQQHQKDDADINVIVKRFGVTGLLPQVQKLPTFQNFEGIFDFQSAQNAIVEANRSFMQVPAAIRARFNNSPQEFVAFCMNKDNIEELRQMGLAPKAVQNVATNSGGVENARAGNTGTPEESGGEKK